MSLKQSLDRPLQALLMQAQTDRAGKVAQGGAPIILPGSTVEISTGIVDFGAKLKELANATDADG